MDISWVWRLPDLRPRLSFLVEYARALRLFGGLSSLGCIRARWEAMARRVNCQFRAHMLAEPEIRSFLNFLDEFSANELPIVFEILRQHLFPDSPAHWLFRAAQMDPRPGPIACRHLAFQVKTHFLIRGAFHPCVVDLHTGVPGPLSPVVLSATFPC